MFWFFINGLCFVMSYMLQFGEISLKKKDIKTERSSLGSWFTDSTTTCLLVTQREDEQFSKSRRFPSQGPASVSRVDSRQMAIRFVTTPKTFMAWQKLRQLQSLDDSQLAAFLLQWYVKLCFAPFWLLLDNRVREGVCEGQTNLEVVGEWGRSGAWR